MLVWQFRIVQARGQIVPILVHIILSFVWFKDLKMQLGIKSGAFQAGYPLVGVMPLR